MRDDPLQQLLDEVSMAMSYARAGLVDHGYRLLIEQCAASDVDSLHMLARYRFVIQSYERRWKIQYQ